MVGFICITFFIGWAIERQLRAINTCVGKIDISLNELNRAVKCSGSDKAIEDYLNDIIMYCGTVDSSPELINGKEK